MIQDQVFSLLHTPFSLIFGVLLVLATGVLSWTALKRTQFARSMITLEALRILLVVMVAITINQPEIVQTFIPDQEPTLVVLYDESNSMQTQDVLTEDGSIAKSRSEWIQPLLANAIWKPYRENFNIILDPFSSNLRQPKKATDLNAALTKAETENSNLRGVVIFSDGSWNTGDSPSANAATRLRMKNVPIYSVVVGSENGLPDLEITAFDVPLQASAGKPTRIPFSVKSTIARDITATLSMTSSDSDDLVKDYVIPANGVLQDSFTWYPKTKGDYSLTLTVPVQAEELIKKNNQMTVSTTVSEKPFSVLIVESFPRWEYRYLRNALSRDPNVEVNCLLFHPQLPKVGGGKGYLKEFPQTLDALNQYDVVFIGDVGVGDGQLTHEDCSRIKGLVSTQAAGLIFMPGFRGRQFSLLQTELGDLYPVHLNEAQRGGGGSQIPAQFQLTESGRESLLTKLADTPSANASVWKNLPGFQWFAPVLRAKSGTTTLAVHATESNENGRLPLLVTKTYGLGKILFMGTDGAWRWREGVEDKYHYRFWGQVARWMAYQRRKGNNPLLRLMPKPETGRVGKAITLDANVMSLAGEPLQNGNVSVQITSLESGNSQTIKLSPVNDGNEWSLFTGVYIPEEKGDHEAIITCQENGSTHEQIIHVQGSERERLGQPADFELMKELSQITRGKTVTTANIRDIFAELSQLSEPTPRKKRVRIWTHWAWGGSMILLLGLFWSGRKLAGKV